MIDFKDILEDYAAAVINRIKFNLDTTGTTASGRTKDSLDYEASPYDVKILARPFAKGVETGRPAGPIPRNMTDIIAKWIDDKGIAAQFNITKESEKRSVAYLIGRKIKEHGTELYRKGGRDDIYTKAANDELENLKAKIRQTIEIDINNKIDK